MNWVSPALVEGLGLCGRPGIPCDLRTARELRIRTGPLNVRLRRSGLPPRPSGRGASVSPALGDLTAHRPTWKSLRNLLRKRDVHHSVSATLLQQIQQCSLLKGSTMSHSADTRMDSDPLSSGAGLSFTTPENPNHTATDPTARPVSANVRRRVVGATFVGNFVSSAP